MIAVQQKGQQTVHAWLDADTCPTVVAVVAVVAVNEEAKGFAAMLAQHEERHPEQATETQ